MQLKSITGVLLFFVISLGNAFGTCEGPDSIIVARIQADNAVFRWDASEATTFTFEIGVKGFTQGEGTRITTADTTVTINGLFEKTVFEAYLYSTCPNGMLDTVNVEVESLYFNDIGMTFLDAPTTGCDLTAQEEITIQITNFGQNPQQLFDFSYSVQDEEGNVTQPFDGLYTGIVGFDSTVVTTFDARAAVQEPGEYSFKIWTELSTDQDATNDTFQILVTHQPVINVYPYEWDFEEWKGGWLIDVENSSNSSMSYGRPNSLQIPAAASGAAAWVTNLIGEYNSNEKTVLISPCFDFSSMENDPYMSFALNFDGEECCDFAFAEISINAGRNWTKIGDGENGINWYNNNEENRWDGNGAGEGWSRVQNRLFGAAGRDSVRLRFIFESDGSNQSAGLGIDDIHIYEPYIVDAALAIIDHQSDIECGLSTDSVVVAIENTGRSDLSSFIVSYSLNGAPAVSETISRTIVPEQRDTFVLSSTINTAMDGSYNLRAWVTSPGDGYSDNDTLFTDFLIEGIKPLPLIEDFEGSEFPKGWTSTDMNIGIDHGSPTSIYYVNLNTVNNSFELSGPNIGPVSAMDVLKFDYRIVDNVTTATNLSGTDKIEVQLSEDCGITYSTVLTIDQSNHIASTDFITNEIALNAYDSKDIKVRFVGTHGGGAPFFVDLDNINIIGCPPSLDLEIGLHSASASTSMDGSVTVSAVLGAGPYTYLWNDGSTNPTLSNVSPGMYEATVTDANGCIDMIVADLGFCSPLGLTISTTKESSVGGDGSAMVTATTGIGPYKYMWETGVETNVIFDLSKGNYSVTVTDANGCSSTSEAIIDLETSNDIISDLKKLTLYPNPSNNLTNVDFELESAKSVNIQVYNGYGQLLKQIESERSLVHQIDLDTSSYPNGIYFVRISVDQKSISKRLLVQR